MFRINIDKAFLIKSIFEDQKSINSICKELKVSRQTILRRLRSYGLSEKIREKRNGKYVDVFQTKNLVGKRFEKLLVIEKLPRDKNGQIIWLCKCKCGNERFCTSRVLIKNKAPACLECSHSRYKDISGKYFYSIKQGAKSRNLEILISIKDIWNIFCKQDRKCALSGLEIKFEPKDKDKKKQTASVDRIDSSKGYTIENIQIVHRIVNKMKNNLPQTEFIYFCERIANCQTTKQ